MLIQYQNKVRYITLHSSILLRLHIAFFRNAFVAAQDINSEYTIINGSGGNQRQIPKARNVALFQIQSYITGPLSLSICFVSLSFFLSLHRITSS